MTFLLEQRYMPFLELLRFLIANIFVYKQRCLFFQEI